MPPVAVRVADVVNLEVERVLQVVARLLGVQTGHDGRPLRDVNDHQTIGFGQHAGDLPNPIGPPPAGRIAADGNRWQQPRPAPDYADPPKLIAPSQ